jgi:hypothetical protein
LSKRTFQRPPARGADRIVPALEITNVPESSTSTVTGSQEGRLFALEEALPPGHHGRLAAQRPGAEEDGLIGQAGFERVVLSIGHAFREGRLGSADLGGQLVVRG